MNENHGHATQRMSVCNRRAARLLVLVAVIGALTLFPPWHDRVAAQSTDEASRLRELAERLLGTQVSGSSIAVAGLQLVEDGATPSYPPARSAELFVGRLPPDLPYEMPLPPGSRLLGSMVRRLPAIAGDGTRTPPWSFEVVLDAPAEAGDPRDFYDHVLAEQGWITAPPSFTLLSEWLEQGGGFVDPTLQARAEELRQLAAEQQRGVYCSEPGGRPLMVRVFAGRDGMLDVRLIGESGRGSRCIASLPSETRTALEAVRLPRLTLPADAQPIGYQRNAEGVVALPLASEITVRSGMSTAELEEHIAEQLTAAGWERQDGEADQVVAWSTWREARDGGRVGFLTVAAAPETDIRMLRFEAWFAPP